MIRFVKPLTRELFAGLVMEAADPLVTQLNMEPWFVELFMASAEHSGVMLDGGYLMAGGGLIPRWHGMAEAWLLLSRHATAGHRRAALLHVRRQMDLRQHDPAFRRIEMYVLAGQPWAEKFGALMGMQQEGLVRRWDPLGRDYLIFSRISEDS